MATPRQKSPIRGNTDFEYDLAIKQHNHRRLKTLLKHKVAPPKGCLIHAYELGHKNLLPLLLDAGADPNYVGHRGWTIMGDCILKSDVSTLKMLLERGADPNLGFAGTPAIVQAARVGDIETLRLLVDAGANLFVDPRVAPHALFEAIAHGHAEVVQFMIVQGVSCTTRKPLGKTAIEYAAEKGTPEIQKLIRNRRQLTKPI
jgi:ankyrin repeat protein